METLVVRNLSYQYTTQTVLQDVEFSVQEGSMCALLGPNGSGKTTLLKCINGILTPHQGEVSLNGRCVTELSRKTLAGLLAVVPQLSAVAFAFTALQMVVMARSARFGAWGKPSRKDLGEAAAVLADLGLGHLQNRVFNELSGGEKQLVLLARAIFQSPVFLLLDEPTAHLDFKNAHLILDMVQRLTTQKHLTTLITLHDPNLAARYCSEMVMLKRGQVYRHGTTDQVFEAQALTAMYDMTVSIETGCQGKCFVMPAADAHRSTWH